MAQISMNNGVSFVAVSALSVGQVNRACSIASMNIDDPALDCVDGQVHADERSWLAAYCDAHERHYGAPFVVG